MKDSIHPAYCPKAKVTCACGATYTMGASKEHIAVEVCRSCHPFYTGKEKLLDTAGRVERFKKRVSSTKTVVKKQDKRRERSLKRASATASNAKLKPIKTKKKAS